MLGLLTNINLVCIIPTIFGIRQAVRIIAQFITVRTKAIRTRCSVMWLKLPSFILLYAGNQI